MKKQLFWSATQAILVLFVVSISALNHENSLGAGVPIVDEFIGCLYEDICNENKFCFNDGLFGKCLDEEKAESAQPDELSLAQVTRVREFIPNLFDKSWSSLKTQCKVRSFILAIRLDLPLSFVEQMCGEQLGDLMKPETSDEKEDVEDEEERPEPQIKESNEVEDEEESELTAEANNFILDQGIPFIDETGEEINDSLNVNETESPIDGQTQKHESIWIDFANPLKSESEAEKISKSIVESLQKGDDPAYASYKLSPNGKTIEIEVDSSESKPEVLKRLRRFVGAHLGEEVKNFGIGTIEKRDQQAGSSLNQQRKSRAPKQAFIIAASVLGGTMFVVLAVSVPLCVRKQRQMGLKRLNLSNDKDDEKCLTGGDAMENSDILGPLVTEAKKSAQNLLAGATGYFSTLSSSSRAKESTSKDMGITKQISNGSIASSSNASQRTNSTSSWSGEPAKMDIDISTGHLILNYLERHLKDRNRLEEDWRSMCGYEAEDAVICEAATRQGNLLKNRPGAVLPYEQSRVRLRNGPEDYINASLIYDHEPRNPAYILTQTPMESTMKDFWQMIWEQASVTIVSLDRADSLIKPDSPRVIEDPSSPVQYWPDEGWERSGNFEIHLVSEHMWCGADYVVRSFYLKNVETSETRTVTQFHFMSWPLGKPMDAINTMLEFRRRVNKSFRGKCSPIVVHCPDGSGASGTYLLLDLVLNRIQSGIKELDIAATLEHVRDQRQGVVPTKDDFEFVLTAIAEEVNALLKSANATS